MTYKYDFPRDEGELRFFKALKRFKGSYITLMITGSAAFKTKLITIYGDFEIETTNGNYDCDDIVYIELDEPLYESRSNEWERSSNDSLVVGKTSHRNEYQKKQTNNRSIRYDSNKNFFIFLFIKLVLIAIGLGWYFLR